MPRIQETNTTTGPVLSVTIPKAVATFLNWKKGDKLEFTQKDSGVFLSKVE